MKNSVKIMLAAAALLSAFSCTKEMAETSVAGLVPMTFEAGFGTKTALDANGKTNLWVAGDKVAVFDGTATQVFTAQSAGASTTLSGSVTEGATSFSAVYPYQEGIVFAADKITASIPARQKAVLGSFDPAAVLAVAKSSTQNFAFQNLVALVKVSITAGNIESIAIKGHMNQDIAGTVEITMNEGVPAAVVTANGSKFAKVSNGDGSALKPGTYYVAVAAGEYAKGLSVILTDIDGKVAEKSGGAAATLARNTITSLGTISDACAPLANTYNWYNDGMDLLVAGHVINKATYGEATLFGDDAQIDKGGVFFVDPMANVTIKVNSGSTGYENLIIIGTDATQRSYVEPLGQIWVANNSTFAIANIKFNANKIKNSAGTDAVYPVAFPTNSTIDKFLIDNSKVFNAPKKPIGTYLSGSKFLNYIGIVNTEYCVAGETAHLINYGSVTAQECQRILFRNNIMYNKSDANPSNQTSAINCGLNNVTVKELIVKGNTFINTNPSSSSSSNALFSAKIVDKATIEDNLVYYQFAYLKSNAILRTSDAGYPSVGSIKHNLLFETGACASTESLYYSVVYAKKTPIEGTEQFTVAAENPFSTFDKTADGGIFTQTATYADYGAKR